MAKINTTGLKTSQQVMETVDAILQQMLDNLNCCGASDPNEERLKQKAADQLRDLIFYGR